jgi:hypothetical protein
MPLKPISEIKVRLGIEPDGETQAFLTNTCYKPIPFQALCFQLKLKIQFTALP